VSASWFLNPEGDLCKIFAWPDALRSPTQGITPQTSSLIHLLTDSWGNVHRRRALSALMAWPNEYSNKLTINQIPLTALFMAALHSRCGHYILQPWFLSSSLFLLFSSPNLSSCRLHVYRTSTRCGLRANLACMSGMCCTQLAENTGRKKSQIRMWANAKYRWRPLFNAAKFSWRPLLECRAVTLPRHETCWNLLAVPKTPEQISATSGPKFTIVGMWGRGRDIAVPFLRARVQPTLDPCTEAFYKQAHCTSERHCCLTSFFSDCRYVP